MSSGFRIEHHPLVLMKPRIVPPYAWVGHIPFAYLAIDLLRPRTLVELGTHSGNSYMAFCQAVRALNLSTRCTAVDAWQGDEHALHYGEEVYQSLRARHDPIYGDFSRLLRSFFDEAVEQFYDSSIDLLHIDGLHTYEAVRHDFETWLPKLSDSAVILLHDTQVSERGFGVHDFFDELKARYPCFGFLHSHGLGVVAVGDHVPAPFVEFMREAGRSPETMRGFFEALANTLVGVDDCPAPTVVIDQLPVVCHLFYRSHDESFDESRMISQPVDAVDGVLDVHFRVPAGIRPDYLRFDPADLPGVFGLVQIWIRQERHADAVRLDRLGDRLGHVGGELLSNPSSQTIRLASFDGDPHVEFEVGSVLKANPQSALLEVTVRIEYEVVVQDPTLHHLLEKHASQLNDMRQLSHQRIQVQNLARDYSKQSIELRMLSDELSKLNDAVTKIEQMNERIDSGLRSLEQNMAMLVQRNFWSWLRHFFRRPQ